MALSARDVRDYVPLFKLIDDFRVQRNERKPLKLNEAMTLINGWSLIAGGESASSPLFVTMVDMACQFAMSPTPMGACSASELASMLNAWESDEEDADYSDTSYDDGARPTKGKGSK